MKEHIYNYFSFKGCVKRKQFLFIFIALVFLSLLVGATFYKFTQKIEIETISQLNMFLMLKSILMIFLTLIWLPAIVKRLHDIGTIGLWAVLLIPSHILDFRNILLFKEITKLEFIVPLSVHYLNIGISLVFLVALFFMPSVYWSNKYSSPNKAINSDRKNRVALS